MVAKTVPDDAKQLTTTISTNARPLRPRPREGRGRERPRTPPSTARRLPGCCAIPAGDHKALAQQATAPSLGKEQPPTVVQQRWL